MNTDKNERILRHIAHTYAERYGEELRREMQELEQSGIVYLAPGLERRVKKLTTATRRRYIRGFATLAACLALMLLLPRAIRLGSGGGIAQSQSAASSAAAETADSAVEESAIAPDMDASILESNPDTAGMGYEIIPLSFELPQNLSVSGFEQDLSRSVYYLEDEWQDDIVLTLEPAPDERYWESFTGLVLGEEKVYALSTADYKMLAFEKDSILYTMTCRYDINSLANLGRNIL